jgi:hypothetical protein
MSAIDEITDERQHDTPAARQLAREAAAELAQLRAHEETLSAIADKEKTFSFTLRQENCKLRAELGEAKRLLRKHTSDNESSAFLARCSTAHPKEQE